MPATTSSQPEITTATTTNSGTVQHGRHRTCSSLKLCYHLAVSYGLFLFLLAPVAAAAPLLLRLISHHYCIPDDDDLAACARSTLTAIPPFTTTVIIVLAAVILANTVYLTRRHRNRAVYLLDFACYKPGADHVVTREMFIRQSAAGGTVTDDNLVFQQKILDRSGLGEETYLPKALLSSPPNPCVAEARAEAEAIMFGTVDKLLAQTGVRATTDIGVVVVNCGLFNPMPSLSAAIVNRYKLRVDIASYSLGGMGCSAGLISIDLAKHLLQVHRNTYALVVSMEILSLNGYWGNNRSMLMSNCLALPDGRRRRAPDQPIFRPPPCQVPAGAHGGADDRAYRCVYQEEDETGRVGVALSKDLMAVAGEALKTNITTLGPLVLPLSEQILFLASLVVRKVLGVRLIRRPNYVVPDFRMAFEHFCIHAGGAAVLDSIEKSLNLSAWHMEPSRMTLCRWGNTSSSSLWYELAYTEAQGRVRRGHRVWQIAFGSGFKCNSAVWRALRTIDQAAKEKGGGGNNPWLEEIHMFPVEVPKVESAVVAAVSSGATTA